RRQAAVQVVDLPPAVQILLGDDGPYQVLERGLVLDLRLEVPAVAQRVRYQARRLTLRGARGAIQIDVLAEEQRQRGCLQKLFIIHKIAPQLGELSLQFRSRELSPSQLHADALVGSDLPAEIEHVVLPKASQVSK